MANKLDLYDTNKLNAARKLINEVYEYNWFPSTPLTRKLNTVLKKLDSIIATEQKTRELYKRKGETSNGLNKSI